MELSKYQEKILRYFNDNPRSNMMISALAGSGKSTMACLLSEHTTTSDIYVAFNNSIAEEFRTKIKNPKTKVMTLHSLGLSIMNSNIRAAKDEKKITYANATLDNLKIYKIIDNELTILDRRMDFMKKMFYKDQYFTLYNLCRLTMTNLADSTALRQIIQDYRLFENDEGYQFPDITDCISMLKNVDGESWNIFNQTGVIDFTDMLYITYWKLERKEWEVPYYNLYTNIMFDEAQDASSIQLNLLKYIKRKGGRYIFILDKNQAIYSFAGSNSLSYSLIPKMFAPIKEFDLPICYRCPSSHLKQVNRLFNIPILPRDDAPKGKIYHIEKEDILSKIHEGDMIISRKNKWLGSVIVDLAKAGKPIQIEDKEMVASIKKIVEKNKNSTAKGLRKDLKEEVTKYSQERAKKNSQLLEAVQENNVEEVVTAIDDNKKIDNYNFILGILKEYLKKNPNATKDNFAAYISNLLNTGDNKTSKSNVFAPKTKPIRICSVHKAKGLEAENVFVLNEGRVCFDFRNSKEQNQQEKNLSYISYTRAKNNLYLVSEKNTNSEEE